MQQETVQVVVQAPKGRGTSAWDLLQEKAGVEAKDADGVLKAVRALTPDQRRALQSRIRLAAMADVPEQQVLPVNREGAASAWRKEVEGGDGPPDKRNHLTLVEVKRLLQLGNIPKQAWEPITYLHQEAAYYMPVAPAFQRIMNYLETLVLTSQSVDGYRSEQTTQAMVGERAPLERHSGMVASGLPAERSGLRAK